MPGLSLEGHYLYSLVERSLDIRHDRSNARIEPAYDVGSRLSAHLILSWQRTHGGLRFPADVEPYPERYEEFHRLLQDNYFQAGAGDSLIEAHATFQVRAVVPLQGLAADRSWMPAFPGISDVAI